MQFVSANRVPVDFISSHGYDDEPVKRLLGVEQPLDDKDIRQEDRTCAAVAHVRSQIDNSPIPHLPLLWTEWNVPGRDGLRDTPYVGPALAEAIRTCDGHVNALSFWTFSDVFEEGGPARMPFEGQFGLRATGGINKPSFYDFALLHELGTQRISNSARDAIITRLPGGALSIALWNLADPDKPAARKEVTLEFRGVAADAAVSLQRVDDNHGNALKVYAALGSPADPTAAQIEQINRETKLRLPERRTLHNGNLTLTLDPNALVLIKVGP